MSVISREALLPRPHGQIGRGERALCHHAILAGIQLVHGSLLCLNLLLRSHLLLPYMLQRCLVPVVLLLIILGKEVQHAPRKGWQAFEAYLQGKGNLSELLGMEYTPTGTGNDLSKTVFPQ